MPDSARYGGLPFAEQIEFFRQKLDLPTEAWTDVVEGEHARAFVVAGAKRDALLADFRQTIDALIRQGTTLAAFRKEFDRIVAAHGWQYRGGRGWRTRVIYETNLRTSYHAGRYRQMKQVARRRPYWRYRHNDAVEHPRPEHVAWDGLVLRHDDPWWQAHYPPNGWGCKCYVETLAERDLRHMGKRGPDTAPPVRWREVTVGTRGPSPRTVRVPEGVDPGWAYNVGEAAWGEQISEEAMARWRASGAGAWERLTPGDWQSQGRPREIPLDRPRAEPGPTDAGPEALEAMLREAMGGEERVFRPGGVPVVANARVLARHVPADRSRYAPLLAETLEDPFEVWMSFERHKGTGKVELRYRVVKGIWTGKKRGLLAVAQVVGGRVEAWTFVPGSLAYLQKQRVGRLVWGR